MLTTKTGKLRGTPISGFSSQDAVVRAAGDVVRTGLIRGRAASARRLLFCLLALFAFASPWLHAQTFQTLPALSFTKVYAGGDPPPQVITAASTGASFSSIARAVSSTGGNWLSISNGGPFSTPQSIVVYANPAVTLAAGTYSAQITLTSTSGSQTQVIPVSLTVIPVNTPSFDETAGALTFSMITKGSAPPLQTVPIRNAGSGTLNWTASASTADGGSWLTLSAGSGTAPSALQVGINPANLPTGALSAGTFVGQVVLQTDGDRTTIPVTVTVGDSVFRQIGPLSFTKAYQGGDPPPQVITAASTGASFSSIARAVSSTGGDWLSISNGGPFSTPQSIVVYANPAVTLAAGTYTAEIILTATDGTQAQVVPISLTVAPPTAAFFDQTAGELTFSMITKGSAPPQQTVPIRNAGSGVLNWTASASTADGGSWLTLSATSGTAPGSLQVGIIPANLPTGGLSAGTFVGQVVLQTDGDRTTIPVTVTVGDSVFRQIGPLSFTKAYQGGDPPPQVITAASTGASFSSIARAVNSTGGNWLSISNGGPFSTPQSIVVYANPAVTLAAGTYSAEIILTATNGTQAQVVPVSLTVAPPTAAFFDETSGELTFSMITKGSAPPLQTVSIRNGGSGTLNWTASSSTADGGSWLTLSATSGTAPGALQVGINPANLPNSALSAGTFVGQVVLQTDGDRTTIPVTVTVGDSVFRQISPLSFTKAYQGGDPPPQVITAASTGTSFSSIARAVSSTGGDWLSISNGGPFSTPQSIVVYANPAVTLAAGTYTAEIILTSTDGTQAQVVPVSLTIAPPTAAFFDETAGALTFFMPTAGTAPPSKGIPIRNAGSGTLNWTASASTADGGSWLTLSAGSGTAPFTLAASVDPTYLPGQGLVAGTFVGQVVLQTNGDTTSIPVTFTVGTSVFTSQGSLSFAKDYQGSNPLSQVITAASTGSRFSSIARAVSSTGGNWLSISNGGPFSTPTNITVSANPASSLAAGTYTAEIILTSTDGTQSQVIPVFLTIGGPPVATATPTFNPSSGSYTASQNVSIADATPGATIYYTTDGSTPTTSSAQYSGPVAVSSNQTLKAIAIAPGNTLSSVATATYTFVAATVSTNALSFDSQLIGSTSSPKTLTITNPGANALQGLLVSKFGANAGDFSFTTNGCDSVAAGGACTVAVTFSPQAGGARSATLNVTYSGNGSPLSVALAGTGTASSTTLTLTPSMPSVVYGQTLNVAASLTGSTPPTGALSFQVDGGAAQSANLSAGAANLSLGVLPAGSHVLTVTYAGDSTYGTTSQTLSFTVAKAVLTATASDVSRPYGQPNPTLTSAISGFVNGDTAAVVGGSAMLTTTATATSPLGTYPITFANNSFTAANYNFTTSPGVLTVTQSQQSISFAALADQAYGANLTLAATASSGLPVSYVVTGPATLAGTTLTITGTGSVTVTASQAGDANYSAASSVTRSFTATAASQTITFTGLPATATYGSAGPYTLSATASSGLPVSYSVTGPATLSGGVLTITGPGTVSVTASQAGNSTYAAATAVVQTITVNAPGQTITFTGLPATATYGSAGPYTLTATASSGLPVSFTVTGPATLSGSVLTITGGGTVSVTATQAGNSNYAAAPAVTQTIVVSAASQTITFTGLPATATYGSAGPYTLTATASSGLPVSYSVTGPATLSGSVLTVTGGGTVSVTATQAGNSNYAAAPAVTQAIVVSAASQTITFSGLPTAAIYGSAGPYTLAATASSGLPVSYTVTGPATLSGSVLTITGAGTVSVTASQAGNSNYAAAAPVTQTIVVSAPVQPATFTLSSSRANATVTGGQSTTAVLTVTPQNGFVQAVSFTCSGLPSGNSCSFSPATVTPAGSPVTSTLTISTSALAQVHLPVWGEVTGGVVAAMLFWPLCRRKRLPAIFLVLGMLSLGAALTGCGTSRKTQTYSVVVTASGGGISQTSTIILTVTN